MAAGLTYKQGLPVTGSGANASVTVTPTSQTTAFDELAVSNRHPEIQISAQYDSLAEVRSVAAGGTTTVTGGMFTATSGTGANNLAAIFSDKQVISRVGQGTEVILTAMFDTPVANNLQQAGPATAMDAMFFCYNGLDFGVAYEHNGLVLIEELTITVAATGAETATVTLDGTPYTVPITAGTVDHNASEIANSLNSQVALFNFTQNEDTVVARAIFPFAETGAFTFSSDGDATGTWSQVSDGRPRTVEITNQADWNGAPLSQPLDPQKLNRYKIVFNGSIDYYIEDGGTGAYVLVHSRMHTNSSILPLFSVATFRIVWGVTNQGNTTSITVKGTEGSAFNQGEHAHLTGTKSRFHDTPSIGLVATNILSIRSREVFGTKVNLGKIILKEVGAFTDSAKGAIVQVLKGATFTGETDWHYVNKGSSIAEYEDSALPVTGGELIRSFPVGSSAVEELLEETILVGEVFTVAMNVASGGATASMDASMVWEEDL